MNAGNYVLNTQALRTLGISEAEERVYLALLTRRTATVRDIAKDLKISQRASQQLLVRVEMLGLATHIPETPRVYVAAEPEFAINALIKQREVALQQVYAVVPMLTEHFAKAPGAHPRHHVLEVITSSEYLRMVVARMFKSFRTEMMSFTRAPITVKTSAVAEPIPPGAQVRIVVDDTYREIPGALDRLRMYIDNGEQVRTFSTLPFKMLVVDRSVAIITPVTRAKGIAPTLLVQRSELLEALCVLFECIWEKAVPVLSVSESRIELAHPRLRLTAPTKALVQLLSAGLPDKAIAQELRISTSTLNRRIADLMDSYGVHTRLQLGMQIAMDRDALSSRRSRYKA